MMQISITILGSLVILYIVCFNIYWFQPFKHIYSAIYLTSFNLPRAKRYKEENILLIGVIQPSLSINSYLSPLVEELNDSF